MLGESRVKVLENSVSVQNDRVTNIRSKYRAGTARQLDVTQAEAQLSQTKVSLIKAQNNVATGRDTLAFLISTPSIEVSLSHRPILVSFNVAALHNELLLQHHISETF